MDCFVPEFESATEQILVSLAQGVATITLNRPEARNALSPELSKGLRAALQWAASNDEVGAVLLTGAGAAFCSGGDVKAMGESNPKDAGEQKSAAPSWEKQFQDLQQRHHGIAGALHQMRKPSIAVLPGPAAGAGHRVRSPRPRPAVRQATPARPHR